jgi:hypothetical protein
MASEPLDQILIGGLLFFLTHYRFSCKSVKGNRLSMMNWLAFQLPRQMSLDSPLKGEVEPSYMGNKKKMNETEWGDRSE